MNKLAIYTSGKASRVLKYYNNYSYNKYPVEFVFYDGTCKKTLNLLFNLPTKIIYYKNDDNLKGKKLNEDISNKLLKHLKINNVRYMFCFGTAILKKPLIEFYKDSIINFHPSLLPSFPGLNAIDQALDYGVKYLGNTAHFIDEGIDTGKILLQNIIELEKYNDYDDVLDLQLEMYQNLYKYFRTKE